VKQTAWDLLHTEQNTHPIITFCAALDGILMGGVQRGKLTEFAGAPGVGKTQLCIQLAVDVQIPECFDGAAGEAMYIDTEGSFILERVVDIATAAVEHCQFMSETDGNDEAMRNFTVESILAGIHYVRCLDHIQLIATIHSLDSFLRSRPRVKLIIIDSIAFPFRWDCEDFSMRTRLLNLMAQTLNTVAVSHGLAVVLTNQMTTRINEDSSRLVPALGESWGHSSAVRVVLYWENAQRHALLFKSPCSKEVEVLYQVTTAGIRDL